MRAHQWNPHDKRIGLILLLVVLCFPSAYAEKNMSTDDWNNQLQFNDMQEKISITREFSFSKGPEFTLIPDEGTIYHSTDGITRIFDAGGNQVSISDDADSPKKFTTTGYLPVSKIYQVPADSFIRQDGTRTRVYANNKLVFTVIDENSTNPTSYLSAPGMAFESVANKIDGGWMEKAAKYHLYDVRSFIADWKVPSPPQDPTNTSNHQTWLFNAVAENGAIAQPCIGYGPDGRWQGVAVYGYQDRYHYYYSTFLPIKTGDLMEGILMYYPDSGYWSIRLIDQTHGNISMNLSVETQGLLDNNDISAFCTLEQYAVSNHNDLPGTTNFTNISIMGTGSNPISFTWDKEVDPEGLRFLNGLSVDSPSQSQVTLYTDKTFTISPSAGAGGTTGPPSDVSILSGSDYTVTITPTDPHCEIGNVIVDGVSMGKITKYDFTNITADHTLNVNFIWFLLISPSANSGGTINPSSAVRVSPGNSQTFNIVPQEGYRIEKVVISGIDYGPITSYTFTDVQEDGSISATFMSTSPHADFTNVTPTTGDKAPFTVTFTDTSTNDPDRWSWNFGDGDWTNATDQNPVHTYRGNGTYTVSLTATNSVTGSNTTVKTNYITVGPLYATTNGVYTVLKFNETGSTKWTPPAGVTAVDYLVVGGGGAAGSIESFADTKKGSRWIKAVKKSKIWIIS